MLKNKESILWDLVRAGLIASATLTVSLLQGVDQSIGREMLAHCRPGVSFSAAQFFQWILLGVQDLDDVVGTAVPRATKAEAMRIVQCMLMCKTVSG